jgi:hypothetical protein
MIAYILLQYRKLIYILQDRSIKPSGWDYQRFKIALQVALFLNIPLNHQTRERRSRSKSLGHKTMVLGIYIQKTVMM